MLNRHCNGSNSFLFVNAVKMNNFKAILANLKILETKPCRLCLGNISKDVTLNNLKTTGLKRIVKRKLSPDYNPINTNYNFLIHRVLMKKI